MSDAPPDPDVLLAEKEAQLRAQLDLVTETPDDLGSISFGKRVGEGTSMAVDRLAAVSTQEQLMATLALVRRARDRVADGTYGTCEECGGEIPAARLEARPWALRCLQHA